MVKQAIGEAACRAADIKAREAARVDIEGSKTPFELLSPSRDIGAMAAHMQGKAWLHLLAGMVQQAAVSGYVSSKHGAHRRIGIGKKATLNELNV